MAEEVMNAVQSDEEAVGQNADQEMARGHTAELKLSVLRDRQAEGGHHLYVDA